MERLTYFKDGYKVGVVYGNVIENEKPIELYFEKMEESKDG